MKSVVAILFCSLLLVGCNGDLLCDPVKTDIIGQPSLTTPGVDAATVKALCGEPLGIRYSMNLTKVLHEQWVYRGGYIYLDGGIVTGWQR